MVKAAAIIWLGAVGLLLPGVGGAAGTRDFEQYCYEERVGKEVRHFSWQLNGSDPVQLRAVDQDQEHITLFADRWATRAWRLHEPQRQTSVRIVREDQNLIFSGKFAGSPLSRTVVIDDSPWYQALSVALRVLVQNGEKETEFWMVRPDNLDVHQMRARLQDRELLIIKGVEHRAWRIRVTAAGVPSLLWHADYWLREDDLFLRYAGRSGPPGTPMTRVELFGPECP